MRDSLIIVLFFAVGILLSCFDLYPSGLEQFNLSFYALCFLMFCVGISIGNNPHILLSFRRLSPKFFLLPVCTILGTLAGCYVSSFFFERHSSVDCMAVGAGFGYYSLSSIIITEYKNAELGTIALLSNIMREIIATMDTTLPIITRCSGQEYVIVSIFHGCTLDFLVPFLVTLLCSI